LLLQLYYEQQLTLEEMSRAIGVSSAVLSRRLKATREELRAAIEARARERTGISADALREGIDLAQLEVDLGALLNENRRTAV
jgi:DNA-binding transcriptional regulator LsrR (DeoR family)